MTADYTGYIITLKYSYGYKSCVFVLPAQLPHRKLVLRPLIFIAMAIWDANEATGELTFKAWVWKWSCCYATVRSGLLNTPHCTIQSAIFIFHGMPAAALSCQRVAACGGTHSFIPLVTIHKELFLVEQSSVAIDGTVVRNKLIYCKACKKRTETVI